MLTLAIASSALSNIALAQTQAATQSAPIVASTPVKKAATTTKSIVLVKKASAPVKKTAAPVKKTTAPVKKVAVPAKKVAPSKSTSVKRAVTPSKAKVITPVATTVLTVGNERFNVPTQTKRNNPEFVNEFQDYIETKIVPKVPGVALAVIVDGQVKVLQAYGVKKTKGYDPINTDTLFRLASVSKIIGATAGAMLVNDGLANWDTTVTSVLPEVEFKDAKYGDQLTIRNILSQSTGLPTHTNDNFIEDGLPYSEVVRRLRNVNFVCPPGKCYGYQNVTYSLISNIIQKKTGKPYEQYVQEKLFTPLGMKTASFGLNGLTANNNYAQPHVITSSGWHSQIITENYYRINPAAGANASITDMSRWILAQLGHNPTVLTPAILNVVQHKTTRNTPAQSHYGTRKGVTDTHYGLGTRIFDYRGDKNFVHHGGYVLGFRSEMVFNRELQIGMIVMSNSNRLSGDVIFKFLDAYEDEMDRKNKR